MSYILSCCSTADLDENYYKEHDIHHICFHFYLDGKSLMDDGSVSPQELYLYMKNGSEVKTSQPNIDEYKSYFRGFLEEGKDILHITLSSGISGAANSANIARREMLEEFPDRKIYIVDSLAASSGVGMLVDALVKMRDKGDDIDTLYHWAIDNRLHIQHWIASTDLTYYIKGGRISKAAGIFGSILNICPVIAVTFDGKLMPRLKMRGKKAALNALLTQMEKTTDNGSKLGTTCFISHSECYDDAKTVADAIHKRFPKVNPVIYNIGSVIGCHTGPNTVALFFWGETRTEASSN